MPPESRSRGPAKLRLFEVLDAERVFSQIVFARDMLLYVFPAQRAFSAAEIYLFLLNRAHMPHQYDRVLHDLL